MTWSDVYRGIFRLTEVNRMVFDCDWSVEGMKISASGRVYSDRCPAPNGGSVSTLTVPHIQPPPSRTRRVVSFVFALCLPPMCVSVQCMSAVPTIVQFGIPYYEVSNNVPGYQALSPECGAN